MISALLSKNRVARRGNEGKRREAAHWLRSETQVNSVVLFFTVGWHLHGNAICEVLFFVLFSKPTNGGKNNNINTVMRSLAAR